MINEIQFGEDTFEVFSIEDLPSDPWDDMLMIDALGKLESTRAELDDWGY
jgi:hypothetical protein